MEACKDQIQCVEYISLEYCNITMLTNNQNSSLLKSGLSTFLRENKAYGCHQSTVFCSCKIKHLESCLIKN